MGAYKYGRTISEFVKIYRGENDLSQVDLAKKLKVGGQYVSNVERGIHKIPKSFCYKFSRLVSQDRYNHLISLLIEEESEKISSASIVKRPIVRRHKS